MTLAKFLSGSPVLSRLPPDVEGEIADYVSGRSSGFGYGLRQYRLPSRRQERLNGLSEPTAERGRRAITFAERADAADRALEAEIALARAEEEARQARLAAYLASLNPPPAPAINEGERLAGLTSRQLAELQENIQRVQGRGAREKSRVRRYGKRVHNPYLQYNSGKAVSRRNKTNKRTKTKVKNTRRRNRPRTRSNRNKSKSKNNNNNNNNSNNNNNA